VDSPVTILILALFGVSTALTYLAIRRAWTRALPGAVIGSIANSLWLTVYSLVKGHLFLAALLIGVSLGLLFTALTVSIALFFRSNPPGTRA
jgi:hypothetical protein